MVLLPVPSAEAGADAAAVERCERRAAAIVARLDDPLVAPAMKSALTLASLGLLTASVSLGFPETPARDVAAVIAKVVGALETHFPAAPPTEAPRTPAAAPPMVVDVPAAALASSCVGIVGPAVASPPALVEWDADISAAWRRDAPRECTDWNHLRPILSAFRTTAVLCGGVVARYARGVPASKCDWDVFIVGAGASARLSSFYEVAANIVSCMLDLAPEVIVESLGSVWQLTSAAWQRPVQLILTSCTDAAEVVADFDMDAARGVVQFGADGDAHLVCPPDACHALRTGEIRDVRVRAMPSRLLRYGREMGYRFHRATPMPMELAAVDGCLVGLKNIVSSSAPALPPFCGAFTGRRSPDTGALSISRGACVGFWATIAHCGGTLRDHDQSLIDLLTRLIAHRPTPMARYVAGDEDDAHVSSNSKVAPRPAVDRSVQLRRLRPTQTAAGVLFAAVPTITCSTAVPHRSLRLATTTSCAAGLRYRAPYEDQVWRTPVITLRRATVSGVSTDARGKLRLTLSHVPATEPVDWQPAIERWVRQSFGNECTVASLRSSFTTDTLSIDGDPAARRVTVGDVVDIECYVKHLYLARDNDVEWHQSACVLRIMAPTAE